MHFLTRRSTLLYRTRTPWAQCNPKPPQHEEGRTRQRQIVGTILAKEDPIGAATETAKKLCQTTHAGIARRMSMETTKNYARGRRPRRQQRAL